MASAGSVSYNFRKAGQLIIEESKNTSKGEELEMLIIDSGAEDFSKEDDMYVVTCPFADLNSTKKTLEDAGVLIDSAEVVQIPASYVDLPEDRKESVGKLLESLDDLDDVNNVYSNANL